MTHSMGHGGAESPFEGFEKEEREEEIIRQLCHSF